MHKGTVQPNGELLRRLRIEQGLTQEDLARLAGYQTKTIRNAEASKPQRSSTLAAICGALKVDIRDVVVWNPIGEKAGSSPPDSQRDNSSDGPVTDANWGLIDHMSIKLWVGQTHGAKKVFYSKQQIKEVLKNSALGWTLVAGEGAESGSTEWEEMGILEHMWKREGYSKVQLAEVLAELNARLEQIFAQMDQRWVQMEFTAVLTDHRVLTDQKELRATDLPITLDQLFSRQSQRDANGSIGPRTSVSQSLPDGLRNSIQSFASFIAGRTEGFFPRKFVVGELDRFINRERSGYFLISGHPGMGKSAILAHLAASRQYIHHFNIAGSRSNTPEAFLRNICAQLIVRFELPYQRLPENADRDGRVLLDLLEQSSRSLKNGERLVIAIDALDEVEWAPAGAGNVLHLPSDLPSHVYFVITTRPLSALDPRGRLVASQLHQLTMDKDAEWNREEVRQYLEERATEPEIKAWIVEHGLNSADFVEQLLGKSEANFMYLRYVLGAMAFQPDGSCSISAKIHFDDLPQGLIGYYREHWRQMQTNDREEFESSYQPVLCVLAAATDLVPLGFLAKWTKLTIDRVRRVVDAWREFLHSERGPDGERRFRIYHNSFREFLEAEVDVGLRESKKKIYSSGLRKYGKSSQ